MFWSLYATTSYSENPQILLNSYIQQAGLEELYTWHPGEAKEVISMVERSNLYGEKLSRDDLSLLDTHVQNSLYTILKLWHHGTQSNFH